MVWEVELTDQFKEWFDGLDQADESAVRAAVDRLVEIGPSLPRPFADTLKGSSMANLKELRPRGTGRRQLRVLYAFDPRRTAILLLGGDKTDRWTEWYVTAIPEAERLYDEYLGELQEEGLL